MPLSRRSFLAASTLAATARATPAADRRKLHEFAYSDVRLTGGPLAAMHRRLHQHYLSLDEDRILKVYRQRAGLPAPGRDMGGWYDADGFVPGHLIGQFISGMARLHANTGDPAAAAKARRLVQGYAAAFAVDGNPFASRKAIDTWACYILDKYEIGLLDAASLAGIDEARALLPRVIDAALRYIPDHTFDRAGVSQPPYDEPYVLPENLFQVHALTGDRRFLDLARRYLLDREFFDPLAAGNNILPGGHGYSHVIALSSAAKAYEVLGDDKYLRAIRNAWDMIEQTQQFASGAWAPKEMFVAPHSGELAKSLTATRDHFETPCCFYAHAKLARYLTSFTGDSRFGDGLERVLYNTILGALDPDDDGDYFYYSDYQAGATKRYYQRKWPCCAGTLLQSVADYPLNLYFHDAQGIYVNLYAASEVRWKSVRLMQETAYPAAENVTLRVDCDTPADFTLRLRIPAWLDRAPRLAVNGKPAGVAAQRGVFAALRRRWRKGDTVELTLPFSLRTVPVDDRTPDTVALMRGPLLLVCVDPPQQATAADAVAGKLRMLPFYQVQREVYTTYLRT